VKYASSNRERSNFGLPSVANPDPVRVQGCGVMHRWNAPPAAWDLMCSQRHSRMKLCPCAARKSRYAPKSLRSGTSAHEPPGPSPSWKLFQTCDPVRYTAFVWSDATAK